MNENYLSFLVSEKIMKLQVVSYEFLEEDFKIWGVKASFQLEDDHIDVEGRYKFLRICEVGALINLPSRRLGGHFALNHHCAETSTYM